MHMREVEKYRDEKGDSWLQSMWGVEAEFVCGNADQHGKVQLIAYKLTKIMCV